jgi:aryl-alcohol dehydrogenase-like predicted oxidoreductase
MSGPRSTPTPPERWGPTVTSNDPARTAAVLESIARRHGATVRQVALAWQLHRSPVTRPIPVTTSFAHVKESPAAAEIRFAPEEVQEISALGSRS